MYTILPQGGPYCYHQRREISQYLSIILMHGANFDGLRFQLSRKFDYDTYTCIFIFGHGKYINFQA